MPIITVQFIKDVVATPEQKRQLVVELTEKFVEILGEVVRPFVYCLIQETPAGEWGIAGVPMPDLAYLTGPKHAAVIERSNELMRAAIGQMQASQAESLAAQAEAALTPATTDPVLKDHKTAVISRLNDAVNSRSLSGFYALMSPDFVNHQGNDAVHEGIDAFIGSFDPVFAAVSDLHIEHVLAIAQYDRVAARIRYHGTHSGNYMGMAPATGKTLSWTGTVIYRFDENSKIVERWEDVDTLGLMIQMGMTATS